jgi:hypothetical protein
MIINSPSNAGNATENVINSAKSGTILMIKDKEAAFNKIMAINALELTEGLLDSSKSY